MAVAGLFTREEVKTRARAGTSKVLAAPAAALQALGPRGVRRMNPAAITPEMPAYGAKRPLVYALGFAPDAAADKAGRPFAGADSRSLERRMPRGGPAATRYNYCCGTLPPNGRAPNPTELECYRKTVENDIAASKPAVILGCGPGPLNWAFGKIGGISLNRGRRFAISVGGHACWYYPVFEPALIRKLDAEEYGRYEDVPGKEWRRVWEADVARAYADAVGGIAPPAIESSAPEDLYRGTRNLLGNEPGAAEAVCFHLAAMAHKRAGVDFETNRLRPYEKGAKVLSLAVGTYTNTLAWALDHPQARWSKPDRALVDKATRDYFFNARAVKIAHNLSFELEWAAFLYGYKVLARPLTKAWEDTMQQAYSLDQRAGAFSLNYLLMLRFGLQLKEQSTSVTKVKWFGLTLEEEGKIDRARLEFEDLASVLRYNGLDSKYTARLEPVQRAELKARGLWQFYRRNQVRRVPACVMAQREGLCVDAKARAEITIKVSAEVKAARAAIAARTGEIAAYRKRFGADFNPASPADAERMLRDILGEKQAGRKFSTREEYLAKMAAPMARLILNLRKPEKKLSTYVNPLSPAHKETVLYPDGRIHTNFNTVRTATGRLSALDPNVQNFPMRKDAWIRALIGCPPDCDMVCVDYAQLEYRVLGMASGDKQIVKSCWEGFDVHMFWAERLARLYPSAYQAIVGHLPADKQLKFYRGKVKSDFVFSSFYGSSARTNGRRLDIPEDKIRAVMEDEFWPYFGGVRKWQAATVAFYEANLYTLCLTGRQRQGPLNYNMQINSGIQGTGSDLVVDAMARLAERAVQEDKPRLAPVLNVHDDLTFYVPRKGKDAYIETIVTEMVNVPYKWAKVVPVAVEVKQGRNWFAQTEIGTFSSKDFAKAA